MARQQGILGCLLALTIGYCMIHQSYSKVLSKEEKEQMAKDIASCLESEKLDQNAFEAMLKDDQAIRTTREGKCFMKCLSEKMDGLDSQGQIDEIGSRAWCEENVEDQGTREKMLAIIKECKEAEPSVGDPCETAATNIECMTKKFKAAGIKEIIGIS